MKLSVIISVYMADKPDFLKQALESIWDIQSTKPDEIILIKDGLLSPKLNSVIDNFKFRVGDRLVIISNSENIGLTKSLNEGIKAATGDFIARMDSDDISEPRRFKLQKEYLEQNADISVVGGTIIEFDCDHEILGKRKFPKDNNAVLKYIYKASPLAHPAVMMRRSLFINGLSYNEKYRTSQDIALWFDVIKAGYKIANLNDVVLRFRRDGDVFKRRSRDKAKNELKIYLSGIRNIYGLFTWKYIFPLARFCFRMMPVNVVKFIYGTKLRSKLLQ